MVSLQKESEWEEIDKKVYSILCGGIISIVDTTEGKKIVGIASASEVITDLIKELLSNREKEIAEEVEKKRREEPCRDCSPYEGCGCSVTNYNEALDKVLSILKH